MPHSIDQIISDIEALDIAIQRLEEEKAQLNKVACDLYRELSLMYHGQTVYNSVDVEKALDAFNALRKA
jgi:uncharacterized protein (UPF0335 family)